MNPLESFSTPKISFLTDVYATPTVQHISANVHYSLSLPSIWHRKPCYDLCSILLHQHPEYQSLYNINFIKILRWKISEKIEYFSNISIYFMIFRAMFNLYHIIQLVFLPMYLILNLCRQSGIGNPIMICYVQFFSIHMLNVRVHIIFTSLK